MVINGIDVTLLPKQFAGARGRTLIIDGDGPCYVAAATVKRLDTALRRFQQHVLTRLFLTKAERASIHLTAHNSQKAGRFKVRGVQPYQGNRTSKTKPPLLEPLRQLVAQRENWLEEYDVKLHYALEADDGMMIDSYNLGEHGVIDSEDKDLRMTPWQWYDSKMNKVLPPEPFGWLQPSCMPSGTAKLIGRGPLFFWAQMLMGDQADHVRGLLKLGNSKVGPALAYETLRHTQSEQEAANVVLDAYRAINQNPLPEGWMLWLLRTHDDTVLRYLRGLALTDENAAFIDRMDNEDWIDRRADE
jgi:hypothetical protein